MLKSDKLQYNSFQVPSNLKYPSCKTKNNIGSNKGKQYQGKCTFYKISQYKFYKFNNFYFESSKFRLNYSDSENDQIKSNLNSIKNLG